VFLYLSHYSGFVACFVALDDDDDDNGDGDEKMMIIIVLLLSLQDEAPEEKSRKYEQKYDKVGVV